MKSNNSCTTLNPFLILLSKPHLIWSSFFVVFCIRGEGKTDVVHPCFIDKNLQRPKGKKTLTEIPVYRFLASYPLRRP